MLTTIWDGLIPNARYTCTCECECKAKHLIPGLCYWCKHGDHWTPIKEFLDRIFGVPGKGRAKEKTA